MSDAMSTLREHAPTMPSVKDARDAVKSHLPSVDIDAVRDRLPAKSHGKRTLFAVVGGLAALAAVFGFARRHRAPASSASLYTPPLPKP